MAIFWHPSKVLYTFFDHFPFVGIFLKNCKVLFKSYEGCPFF